MPARLTGPIATMSAGVDAGRTLAAVLLRLGIAAGLLAAVAIVAAVIERRTRSRATPAHRSYDYPRQVLRGDFARPDTPWLVVVFSSESCSGCASVVAKAAVLDSNAVAVVECEFGANRVLHERYAIDGVPTTIVADADGVVQRGFIGAVSATDLWVAVADLRHPPAEPRVCQGHGHDDHDDHAAPAPHR